MTDDAHRVAELIADLDGPGKPKIRAAVDALTLLAAQSRDLRARLEALLNQGSSARWPVAYILGQLPEPSGATIRNLLSNLDHREPDIRWAIALLLTRIAKTHGEVVGLLIAVAAAGTANQKRMSIYCLRDLARTDTESLSALVRALDDADPTVRVAGVTSLKSRSDVGEFERAALLRLFAHDVDLRVRNAAAITLASWGSASGEFMAALQQAIAGDNAQLKKAALAALTILQKD